MYCHQEKHFEPQPLSQSQTGQAKPTAATG